MAYVCVHVTRWTLQLLRTGLMAEAARKLKSTDAAAERFFLGTLRHFLDFWRQHRFVAADLHRALHMVERRAKANVWPMIMRAPERPR